MSKRALSQINPNTLESRRLVLFEYKDGTVMASWEPGTEGLKGELEHIGIQTARGVYRIEDGKKFFDALPVSFSNSSFLFVEDVPHD